MSSNFKYELMELKIHMSKTEVPKIYKARVIPICSEEQKVTQTVYKSLKRFE